jgi:probable LLM family oxidoreductase
MEIGIDSFAALLPDLDTGRTSTGSERMALLLAEIETADQVGLDVFGIGEHHRAEYLDSVPAVILAAAAARTSQIRLTSAVTVLSTADPVRVFQQFATLDLISMGRAEIVVGRGSSTEAFPLFGYPMTEYNALFAEKLSLLLKLRDETHVTWQGKFRSVLTGQGVFPRPHQDKLPVWLGVGSTPESFARAGILGLPLLIAVIGGSFARFRPLVDLYREAGRRAGHAAETLKVGVHAFGFVAETAAAAQDLFFPGWEYTIRKVGGERGRPAPSRAQFDAACSPAGTYLIGDPETVAERVFAMNDALGGVSRITFQMTSAALEPAAMQRSIELLGTRVAPLVRAGTLARANAK